MQQTTEVSIYILVKEFHEELLQLIHNAEAMRIKENASSGQPNKTGEVVITYFSNCLLVLLKKYMSHDEFVEIGSAIMLSITTTQRTMINSSLAELLTNYENEYYKELDTLAFNQDLAKEILNKELGRGLEKEKCQNNYDKNMVASKQTFLKYVILLAKKYFS